MPNILKGLSEQITLIMIDKNYINQYYIGHRNEPSTNLTSEVNDNDENWVGEDDFSRSV